MTAPSTRCINCQAPIRFQPGAGSRLCHFCDTVNLVREQTIAVPSKELQIDQVFLLMQQGRLPEALGLAEKIIASGQGTVRLRFYRAHALYLAGKVQEAVYQLVDLTGEEAPPNLRADIHAELSEILWTAGRQEEALAAVEKALKLMPGHPAAALVKVKWFLAQNRLEAAARVAEETLHALQKPFPVTFPPPPLKFWLLLARIHLSAGRLKKAVDWLENMLLGQLFAPLPAVAEALALLGRAMLSEEEEWDFARELMRSAVILEGHEKEAGKILRETLEKRGEDWTAELEEIQKRREQLLQRLVTILSRETNMPMEKMTFSSAIHFLGEDADTRVDVLQKAAGLLGFDQFDRGTLYPLKTLEDFCRWLEASRARHLVSRTRWERQEKERVEQLRRLRERTSSAKLPVATTMPRRAGWKIWLVAGVSVFLALLAISFAAWGDRWVCQFQGKLRAVECDRLGRECWLVVDGGEEARKRHQQTSSLPTWKRWYVRWRDQKLSQEGIWYFPLNLLWWKSEPETFRRCVGGVVEKESFNFLPRCRSEISKN